MVLQFNKVFKTEKYTYYMIAEEENKLKYIRDNTNQKIHKLTRSQPHQLHS